MFRKLSIAFLIFILVSILTGTLTYASNPNNVIDNLGYLTESEITELQSRINSIKETYVLDTVIVITDNTEGKSSMVYADDYYDYNDYGLDSKYSGLLMLINMQKREVWISTEGKAIDIFTDSRIKNMVNNVTNSLSNGNYYDACKIFLNDVSRYANSGIPKGQYRAEGDPPYVNATYLDKVLRLMRTWYIYLIALAISIIATAIVSYSSKGKVTIDNRTYEEGGSFALSENSDIYLRETTTRTKIERNSGGGSGRSSTHSGSSGRSHGGGGGRF
ncbi:MAG: hypothetical protein BWY74_00717 [Firmicutes bacterium ADurb.Bin419]|nr:MAG: hypothetical protein BWY74_00717 [Firmicutes bacterium ADurb.Bin419]